MFQLKIVAPVVGAAIFCCYNSCVAPLPVSSRTIYRTIFRSEICCCLACRKTNNFRIVSIEFVDGKPKVEWEPKTNRWTGAEIQAVLKGAAALDGEWKAVEGATAEEKAAMRFFKVVVEVQ